MKKVLLFLLLALNFSGCVPMIIGGTAAGVINSNSQDREFSKLKSDVKIWTSIKNQFLQYNTKDLFRNVSVKVIEGRVLLTGNVKKPHTRILAEKIAWIPDGVIEVINEIEISEKYSIKNAAKDSMITTKVKTRLALEKHIRSANYKIETVDSMVYVIGMTKSQDELSRAIDLISRIGGVKKVVNYVTLRD
jgi:osmotically-inducible protein OsmY